MSSAHGYAATLMDHDELAADGDRVPLGECPPPLDDPEALDYLAAHGWPTK